MLFILKRVCEEIMIIAIFRLGCFFFYFGIVWSRDDASWFVFIARICSWECPSAKNRRKPRRECIKLPIPKASIVQCVATLFIYIYLHVCFTFLLALGIFLCSHTIQRYAYANADKVNVFAILNIYIYITLSL